MKVSQAATPSEVRGPKLMSRLRTRCLAANSAGLLCKGSSGESRARSRRACFARVFAISLSRLLVTRHGTEDHCELCPQMHDLFDRRLLTIGLQLVIETPELFDEIV